MSSFVSWVLRSAWLVAILAPAGAAPAPPAAAPPAVQAAPAAPLPPLPLDSAALLQHLEQAIRLYRHTSTGVQVTGLSSDAFYRDTAQALTTQVVQLAFQAARSEAAVSAAVQAGATPAGEPTQAQRLARTQGETQARIQELQARLAKLGAQLAAAPAARQADLAGQRDDLQAQLELQQALLDAVQKMSAFVAGNAEPGGNGLESRLAQLSRSLPAALTRPPSLERPAPSPAPAQTAAASAGLIREGLLLYDDLTALHQTSSLLREADAARTALDQLRAPLRDALRATIHQSQQWAGTPETADPAQAQQERLALQSLTTRFRQLSGILLPLGQESLVLGDAHAHLEQWHDTLDRASRHVLHTLLVRAGAIAAALAATLLLSELWRRVTFRLVRDPRRRRQFLMLRRVATGFMILVVLTLGFVSEFSSLATFAGFITAGIAVGLQAVLLSVAAYFFIIGRYGIRVGDRISIAGITGDVVDIGLVRLYLMELAGTGLDFHPTGRIVVFSNAVLFQAGTPLYKQIPGTEYTWHEVAVLIAPDGDHRLAQSRLLAAVEAACAPGQEAIAQQHATMERHADFQLEAPRPEARLQFVDAGLELRIRYPVPLRQTSSLDEAMTRSILELWANDPALKGAVVGMPRIRSAVKA